jgi:poly(3-hydroxybutyrate) depolymerase
MPVASSKPLDILAYDLFEGIFPRAAKPAFGLDAAAAGRSAGEIRETPIIRKPFCTLLHFRRKPVRADPKLLIVAPLSGHFAVLLRDMAAALLPEHDLYVTDWTDARLVPKADGAFGLADNIGYVLGFLRKLGAGIHVIGLCQSAVPALAATAILAMEGAAAQPKSLILLGGPIDPRVRPTRVERLLRERSLSWLENNVIVTVPAAHPGGGRRVYPGSLQLTALMAYLARHVRERGELFGKLVEDDGLEAATHPFLNLYTAVMDLPAEFFLENIKAIFQDDALPRGHLTWHDGFVQPAAITRTALMTIEAEHDDISSPGQTYAAHALCANVPTNARAHHLEPGIGHFGLFHGRYWRSQIMPKIRAFIRSADSGMPS